MQDRRNPQAVLKEILMTLNQLASQRVDPINAFKLKKSLSGYLPILETIIELEATISGIRQSENIFAALEKRFPSISPKDLSLINEELEEIQRAKVIEKKEIDPKAAEKREEFYREQELLEKELARLEEEAAEIARLKAVQQAQAPLPKDPKLAAVEEGSKEYFRKLSFQTFEENASRLMLAFSRFEAQNQEDIRALQQKMNDDISKIYPQTDLDEALAIELDETLGELTAIELSEQIFASMQDNSIEDLFVFARLMLSMDEKYFRINHFLNGMERKLIDIQEQHRIEDESDQDIEDEQIVSTPSTPSYENPLQEKEDSLSDDLFPHTVHESRDESADKLTTETSEKDEKGKEKEKLDKGKEKVEEENSEVEETADDIQNNADTLEAPSDTKEESGSEEDIMPVIPTKTKGNAVILAMDIFNQPLTSIDDFQKLINKNYNFFSGIDTDEEMQERLKTYFKQIEFNQLEVWREHIHNLMDAYKQHKIAPSVGLKRVLNILEGMDEFKISDIKMACETYQASLATQLYTELGNIEGTKHLQDALLQPTPPQGLYDGLDALSLGDRVSKSPKRLINKYLAIHEMVKDLDRNDIEPKKKLENFKVTYATQKRTLVKHRDKASLFFASVIETILGKKASSWVFRQFHHQSQGEQLTVKIDRTLSKSSKK